MKPYDINLIADYVILRLNSDEEVGLINLKLQKLLYYIQAWSLGIYSERFVDSKFEAWVHGPVSRKVYDRFKDKKTLYSNICKSDVMHDEAALATISPEDRDFIDYILDNYAGFSGIDLEQMTHSETPWIEARQGYLPMQSCAVEIRDDTMATYYGNKWAEINGKKQ